MSELDRLVFHAFDKAGSKAYSETLRLVEDDLLAGEERAGGGDTLARLEEMGFEWGGSDRN